MFNFDFITIMASLPGLVMALVFHEYAHARVAVALGDDTPRYMGRLTLNPLAHIDPIGMIMLFLVRFGWAKPVMINPSNFRNPRRDDVLVSIAGPAANLILAFIALLAMYILNALNFLNSQGLVSVLSLTVLYNINFAIFNMLPIPPLDGSHVVAAVLPRTLSYTYQKLSNYGFIILIVLIYTPFLSMVLIPAQRAILGLFNSILFFL